MDSKMKVENLDLYYGKFKALKNINLDLPKNEITAFIGPSGCGKSTLLKSLNRMNDLVEGCKITGKVTLDGDDIYGDMDVNLLRKRVGMVFQHFNLFPHLTILENVTLAPIRHKMMTEEQAKEKAMELLNRVGVGDKADNYPAQLSGGQKQRVAIAGIVAMKPKCIILDEPTAMLDPHGRADVMRVLHELNRKEGVTVILITHYMEEVIDADRVFVMDEGKVVMEGTPRQIFSRVEELKQLRLDVPQVTELAYELSRSGVPIRSGILTNQELIDELMKLK